MNKIMKIGLALIFLAILQGAVSTYFTQIYGGVTVIPHSDLEADIFWLLLSCFGLLIVIFLQLLFRKDPPELWMLRDLLSQIIKSQPQKKRKPVKRKTRKAQKEPGKKQKTPESKANQSHAADESQAPGAPEKKSKAKPSADEAPEIWREEEFE